MYCLLTFSLSCKSSLGVTSSLSRILNTPPLSSLQSAVWPNNSFPFPNLWCPSNSCSAVIIELDLQSVSLIPKTLADHDIWSNISPSSSSLLRPSVHRNIPRPPFSWQFRFHRLAPCYFALLSLVLCLCLSVSGWFRKCFSGFLSSVYLTVLV